MRSGKDLRRLAGVTATALAGTIFFFVIIGVFGQPFAITGLVIFVAAAIAIYREFPVGGGLM
jgi:dolichol kinase